MNQDSEREGEGEEILIRLLTPGAGKVVFEKLIRHDPTTSERRQLIQLLSRIISAMRLRAEAQSRSAVRSETSRLIAVSEIDKPAK